MTTLPRHSAMRSSHRAMTLLELTISLTILAMVMLAAQSALMVSAKAIPDGRSNASRQVATSNALDMLASELQYATAVTTMTSTQVVFTVPDRSGDGQPETIGYAWSGTAGAPLTRTLNNGSAINVADSVQQFQLTFDKRAVALPTTYSEGSETLLAGHESSSGLQDAAVTSSNWRAQIITASLPANAVSWRVTRMWLRVRKKSSSDGETRIQLRPAMAGVPSTSVIDEATLLENTLTSNYVWREFNFANAGGLGPNATLCIVLKWISNSESCETEYRNYLLGLGAPTNTMLNGNDSGWNTTNSALQYYVAGTATTANPISYAYYLTNVRCTMRTSAQTSAGVRTSIRILNEPQVAGP